MGLPGPPGRFIAGPKVTIPSKFPILKFRQHHWLVSALNPFFLNKDISVEDLIKTNFVHVFKGDVGPTGLPGPIGETGYGLPGPKVRLSVFLSMV